MPKGIINPKGRANLSESARDMTPQFWGETDEQLGLTEKKGKKISKSPYAKIKSKDKYAIIEATWKLIFKAKMTKGTIVKLMIVRYGFTSTAAEVNYYKAFNKGVKK